jgi:hypothetical protein
MGQLLVFTVDMAGKYHECAARHTALVDYVNGRQ